MAWISMDFNSKILKRPVELEMLLPQSGTINRVLFLLHGARENRTAWLMKSQIECFAADKNICVVMPDGMNSFYVNTKNSYHFMDFICGELPQLLKNMYFVPEDKNLWMIAGNDIGGYGALRCGLQATDVFGYIASFSGTLDIVKQYEQFDFVNMWNVFGDKEGFLTSDNNLYKLIANKSTDNEPVTNKLPTSRQNDDASKILLTCGEQDKLFAGNKVFYEWLCNRPRINASNGTNPNDTHSFTDWGFLSKKGGHDWSFWNDSLRCAIEWFCQNPNYKEGFLCQ